MAVLLLQNRFGQNSLCAVFVLFIFKEFTSVDIFYLFGGLVTVSVLEIAYR